MKTKTILNTIIIITLGLQFCYSADVSMIIVAKGQKFLQTGDTTVVQHPQDPPFLFNAMVDASSPSSVISATVRSPINNTYSLSRDSEFSTDWNYSWGFTTINSLNTTFPDGNYTITLQTSNDGTKNLPVTLTGSVYPNTPRISNYNSARSINSSNNFTLTWDPFTGGTVNDLIMVEIRDEYDQEVFTTGISGPSSLDGIATGVTIPANTFSSGKTYYGVLRFVKITQINTTSYPIVPIISCYYSETEFTLQTQGNDTTPPSLVNVMPEYNRTVPTNSSVVFFFSEPMQPQYSINWNINVEGITYLWNSNRTVLFCIFKSLPTNRTVTWTLNPPLSQTPFRDIAGNELPSNISGSFNTSGAMSPNTKDVIDFLIGKTQFFLQTNNTPVQVPLSPDFPPPYTFIADCMLSGFVTATNATILLPNATTIPLELDGDKFDYEDGFNTKAELDSKYPGGTYTLTFYTVHNGIRTANLSLPPSDQYPSTPTIANFTEAQSINPSNNFTLRWNTFTGGTTNDFISLEIETQNGNEVFHSPHWLEPNRLRGTDTSVLIPANTLSPGKVYNCNLIFAKITSTNVTSYPDVTGAVFFAKITLFNIKTIGTPLPPRLFALKEGNNMRITLNADPDYRYVLESSLDLKPGSWVSLGATLTSSGWYYDSDFIYVPKRFYRVRQLADNEPVPPKCIAIHGYVRNARNNMPVKGAVVSTSLDPSTAVTEADGSFFLQTTIPSGMGNQMYTITIQATGFFNYSSTTIWGDQPRNQQFYLTPLN